MTAAQDYIAAYKEEQPLPHVISSLTSLIADPESTMKDFEDVIKMDPILVARLLRLVNSPYYGLSQPVDSISRAVAYLGMKNLHNLIVADAIKNIFKNPTNAGSFSKQKLWLHSAAVSICAKMVAERIFGINGDDAFLCGILHDFGLLVEEQTNSRQLAVILPLVKNSAQLIDLEQQHLATNHCEIGYLLACEWNMPQAIAEAIRDHHLISPDLDPASLSGIIQIAEFIAARLEHTILPDVTASISPRLLAHLQDNQDEYTILLEDFPEEMEKSQAIYG